MSDKGIIFSAPMVRALLDGTKTQTRRLLTSARVFATPEQSAFTLKGDNLARALQGASDFRHLHGDGWFWEADAFDYQAPATRTGWMAHIGYAPGDRLYVREAHGFNHYEYERGRVPKVRPAELEDQYLSYRATEDDCEIRQCLRYRPSMHMPRWASRLTLTVTDVRVQRLQDIAEADIQAEGVEVPEPRLMQMFGMNAEERAAYRLRGAQDAWSILWDSLHTKPGTRWEDDPCICAVSFDVRHGNIDAEGA